MDKISCELTTDRIACDECGQVHHVKAVQAGYCARCTRCGAMLYRNCNNMFEATLAMAITGLILFTLTNFFPLIGLRTQGVTQEITLWKACFAFWNQDFQLLSILLLLTVIVFPLFHLFSLTWVMLTLRFQWDPKLAIVIYRWMAIIRPWAMLEIFMLGMLVAVVKLGDIAILIIGPAFWSFALLMAVMAAAAIIPDSFTVWNRLQVCRARF